MNERMPHRGSRDGDAFFVRYYASPIRPTPQPQQRSDCYVERAVSYSSQMSRLKEYRPQIVTYGYPRLGSSRVRQTREFTQRIVITERSVELVDPSERRRRRTVRVSCVLCVQHDAKLRSHRAMLEFETLKRLCAYRGRTKGKDDNADGDYAHRTSTTPA